MAFLTSIPNILLIILGFGVLIFIHELGHFLAAKWAGIRTEAFAVGMGPVALAWRKGIGLRFGSTFSTYEKRVLKHQSANASPSANATTDTKDHEPATLAHLYRIGDQLGLGETEYSLRWLPIGGFVKMLGQEDANPNYVSDDPRSYNRCPVGKRMIVVSAGVIMNLLLAIVLFVFAFTFGVKFEAPVVGGVNPLSQAATVRAENAAALGVSKDGIQPGDVVLQTNGDRAATFADLQIASAMNRPQVPVRLEVRRQGVADPLVFNITPEKDRASGLLSFGIAPGSSTILRQHDEDERHIIRMLDQSGLTKAGVRPGMRMISAGGEPVSTYQQFSDLVQRSVGKPVPTEWSAVDERGGNIGPLIHADMPVRPDFQDLLYADEIDASIPNFEQGLFGLVPLVRIEEVLADSKNQGVLREGDVVLRLGDVEGPRWRDFFSIVQKHRPGPIDMIVLRDGVETPVTAIVSRRGTFNSLGMLNVLTGFAWEVPMVATPLDRVKNIEEKPVSATDKQQSITKTTPAANLRLLTRDRIAKVGGMDVHNWAEIRRELLAQTRSSHDQHSAASVILTIVHPTIGNPQEEVALALSADDVAQIHKLGWIAPLSPGAFEPIYTTLTSGGNPLKAIAMGFKETHKTVMLTYLTLDRLFRGSVGISQLRGPVGIVHIGTKVADRGFLYILFFLGMISVNLAVINFLPMPIVDGGLFLFLIYEKFKGKPPPLAFQNAATIVGICMIASLFLITFYNDVMRLLS